MVASPFGTLARLIRRPTASVALALGLFPGIAAAAAPPAASCGLPAVHPRTRGPVTEALRTRAGFPPAVESHDALGQFAAAGGTGACPNRPTLAGEQLLSSSTLPIDVRFRPQDAALAADILVWAEQSWTMATGPLPQGMGFPQPLDDGDGRLDIYLEPSGVGGIYCPEYYEFGTNYIGTTGFVAVNPEIADEQFIRAAVAHEIHHAIQFSIDALEDISFMEMTSAYAMEKIFDDSDQARYFIDTYQAEPHRSLDYFGGTYHYGASLFLFWLFDEIYEAENLAALQYVWLTLHQEWDGSTPQDVANEPDWLDQIEALAAQSDLTTVDLYAAFSRDRWYTGDHDDGTFAEGGTFVEPERDELVYSDEILAEDGGDTFQVDDAPSEFGTSYIQVNLDGPSAEATLDVEWDNATGKSWGVMLLRESGDRELLGTGAAGSETVTALEGESWVVIALANLGDGDHDPDMDDWGPSNAAVSLRYDDPNASDGGEGGGKSPLGCTVASTTSAGSLPVSALLLVAGVVLARRRRAR